jgi:hypothetical protein
MRWLRTLPQFVTPGFLRPPRLGRSLVSPERQPFPWSYDTGFRQKSFRFKALVLLVGFVVLWGILTLIASFLN